jgi:TnpA family transposase
MIYHYFNCDISSLEEHLNKHAKDGFVLEEFSVHGCTAHIVMSYEVPEKNYKKKD